MNSNDFLNIIKKQEKIIGHFSGEEDDSLMDLDIKNTKFKNFSIENADFTSGVFSDCYFEDNNFINCSLVGVTFSNCIFKKCNFINGEIGMSFQNCTMSDVSFSIIKNKDLISKYVM